tara:strand:+ start:586 stop:1062 length:477 start_codon:yes stop_codon:yes gene_type:complete
MKITIKSLSTVVLAIITLSLVGVASAHHSFAMFDRNQEHVYSGEVVRWAFNSPHTALYIRDDDGALWAFEGSAPARMFDRDPLITGYTFQPGDRLTVVGCPLRDGRTGGAVGLVIKDDIWYNPQDGGCNANEENWRNWLPKGYMSKADAVSAGEAVVD